MNIWESHEFSTFPDAVDALRFTDNVLTFDMAGFSAEDRSGIMTNVTELGSNVEDDLNITTFSICVRFKQSYRNRNFIVLFNVIDHNYGELGRLGTLIKMKKILSPDGRYYYRFVADISTARITNKMHNLFLCLLDLKIKTRVYQTYSYSTISWVI